MRTLPDRELVAAVATIREEIANSARDRRRIKRTLVVIIAAGAILAAAVCVLLFQSLKQSDKTAQKTQTTKTQLQHTKTQQQQTQDKVRSLTRQQEHTLDALKDLAKCISRSGNVPDCIGQKDVPGVEKPPPGPRGPQGRVGPAASQAQVTKALRRICGPDLCQGGTGPQGPPPTPQQVYEAAQKVCAQGGCGQVSPDQLAAQVATAVAAQIDAALGRYCSTRNECRGKAGADGKDGQNATDAQVAQAVQSYCDGRGGCQPAPTPPTQDQVNAAIAAYCGANPAACQPAPVVTAPATP